MFKIKNWLYAKFGFSKKEFNGVLFLCALLLIITFLPYLYVSYVEASPATTQTDLITLKRLETVAENQKHAYYNAKKDIEEEKVVSKSRLFKFDPNRITAEEWQLLGLSKKQAQSVLNYRNKGGKFYSANDVQKMYAISATKFQELAPYIAIAKSSNFEKYPKRDFEKNSNVKKEMPIIELNGADTLKLDEIKGVGVAFARRIAKYKNKLGGFYKKEQLLEVYGLDSLKYSEIKDQVTVNANTIKKIAINQVQFDDLKGHPYLSFKQINAIINYRKQHGDFKSAEDLRKIVILPAQTIDKLLPYLIY